MKLFLASSGLSYIKKFVERDPRSMNMLFVPTAGNIYDNVWWIDKDREVLTDMGFKITELDIENASDGRLQEALSSTDIVYIAGGDTFYLLKQLRQSGFDKLLYGYVENGGLYAGASAGALVAGPDIEPVTVSDESAPDLETTKGLGWVDFVPMPHYDMPSRTNYIDDAIDKYKSKYKLVALFDDQAIVIDGDGQSIVDSPRGKIELEWFERNADDLI